MSVEGNATQAAISSPLVSVIIPAFNAECFMVDAIDSVLAQDYPNLEIIVVDDGSTDTTPGIVAGYGGRVRLISQANRGCAAARNAGVRAAHGHFVAFLDADDVWWPHKIRLQVDALTASGYRMAYSRFIVWTPDAQGVFPPSEQMFGMPGNPGLSGCELVTGNIYPQLLLDCIVWTSTVLVENTLLQTVGLFDESLVLGEDYDLWLRLSKATQILSMAPPTALYRQHPQSITRSVHEVNFEYVVLNRALTRWGEGLTEKTGERLTEDTANFSPRMRSRLAQSMVNHGYLLGRCGNHRAAANAYLTAIRHGERRVGPILRYCLCKIRSIFPS